MINLVDFLVSHGTTVNRAKSKFRVAILQMIERNLEQLKLDEQVVLEGASVAGAEFHGPAVAAALEREIGEIEVCCTQLSRHEQFVAEHAQVVWPDGTVAAGFRFRHALYQEVLYDRLPAGHQAQSIGVSLRAEKLDHGEPGGRSRDRARTPL